MHVLATPVLGISWYPHAEDMVIPVGWDSSLGIYSLSEPRCPVFTFNFDSNSGVCFPFFSNLMVVSKEFKYPNLNCARIVELIHVKTHISKFPEGVTYGETNIFKNDSTIMDIKACPYTGFVCACDLDGSVFIGNVNERFLKSRASYFVDTLAYSLKLSDEDVDDDQGDNKLDINENYEKMLEREFVFHDVNELENGISLVNSKIEILKTRKGLKPSYYKHLSMLNPCSVNRVALNSTLGSLCWLASGGNIGLIRIQCISRWAEELANCYLENSSNL
ncbi:hypothetical protein MXB_4424 [Myxobolus squamalis]|nr:hypothetical protein MXB_4424 [Myxobolus squamalis]